MNVQTWLGNIYAADKKMQGQAAVNQFKKALAADNNLMAEAQAELIYLNELIATRSEQACFYSTKYRNYLKEALA